MERLRAAVADVASSPPGGTKALQDMLCPSSASAVPSSEAAAADPSFSPRSTPATASTTAPPSWPVSEHELKVGGLKGSLPPTPLQQLLHASQCGNAARVEALLQGGGGLGLTPAGLASELVVVVVLPSAGVLIFARLVGVVVLLTVGFLMVRG